MLRGSVGSRASQSQSQGGGSASDSCRQSHSGANRWRYDAGDGQPLVVRSAASIGSEKTQHQLLPGTVFAIDEQRLGEDGVLYLRLADGRGWAFDRKPNVGVMCHRVSTPDSYWRYDAGDQEALVVRQTPEIEGQRTETVLQPGEVFCVSTEQLGADGILYLQLADGRGWAFDHKPGVGVMCSRHQQMEIGEAPRSDLWRYVAADRKPIWIRKLPHVDAERTQEVLEFGDLFLVAEEKQGEDGVLYLELADESGWVFDRKPDVGVLCERHEAPVWLHIYDVPSHPTARRMNGALRRIGTGAFHAGVEVYGQEWSFGSAEEDSSGTGLFVCAPRGCEGHAYRESLPMGHTPVSEEDVRRLLGTLSKQWLAKDYDMLRKNCCHFSDMLCQQLQVGKIPGWIRNLSGIGRTLDNTRQSFHDAWVAAAEKGRNRRGASEAEGYRFGDFSTGVLETFGEKARELLDHKAVRNIGRGVLSRLSFDLEASPSFSPSVTSCDDGEVH